ncbi:MAG: hypothetical protein MJ214_05505 [Bacilli bacterium]|nr:hypothetical protein [Bacilli bacterium]
MADNSAMTQFSVNTEDYAPRSSNPYEFGNSFLNGAMDVLSFGYTAYEREKRNRANEDYNTRMANALEEARLNSAREYERYMDSTKYQRAMKDAEKAGINPYTLLGSSSLATNASSSASAVQAHKSSYKGKNKSSDLLTSALKVLTLIALKA